MELPSTSPPDAVPPAKPRVLIVDDEVEVGRALRRLLRSGYALEVVVSGAEALEKLATFPADVILSDFRMPRMNGVELLTAVRKQLPNSRRVIISGGADIALVRSAITEGVVCGFLNKPWDTRVLVELVRELAAMSAPPPPGEVLGE